MHRDAALGLRTIVFAAAVAALSTLPAHAQSPAPSALERLGPEHVAMVEIATNGRVRPAFFGDDHTWMGYEPAEIRIDRSAPDEIRLLGSGGGLFTLSLKSWIQSLRPASRPAAPVLTHEYTKPEGALATGQKWKARMVADHAPVEWCADTKGQVEGEFEVGKAVPYTLTWKGQVTTLEVLPVVETGRWSRCVSGKRYARMLYSPQLDSVVSVEFISYRTNGQPHESSFRFNVKEVR